MKKSLALLLGALLLLGGCGAPSPAPPLPSYDRQAAVAYARAHVFERNRAYPEFENNCTNYVSQCLLAGGMELHGAGTAPQNGRIRYENTRAAWFCTPFPAEAERPPAYSVSTSFVRTDDFFSYWSETRGLAPARYPNTFAGLEALLETLRPGDVFVLYAPGGAVAHLGLITRVETYNAFFCANSTDRDELSICDLPPEKYPELGVLSFS